jgi:hypothetical protein
LTIIIITKLMLCNIIWKIIIIIFIYIEELVGIFVVYIGIITPLFH